ncbi:MAG: LLM class flavin-dependent oxidoreductase, partial [Microbacteriaceae bacterium]|nr:LLM class flavin-dependent oxidoreductase [Microbacteriaceae bacterium]
DTVREVAAAAERAGLRTFWLNETPGADALAGLAAAAEVTERLRLGTGVIPLDRFPAARIAERVAAAGIPAGRLLLGVGSGGAPHAAAFVASEVRELRERVASPVLVGALGPLVRRVGAELADGLVLSWLSPDAASAARDEAVAAASSAGRPRPHVVLYARTAVEAAAHPALRAEAERYGTFPGYAANFARLGEGPLDGSILADDEAGLRARIAAYDGTVDELVLRVIAADGSAAAIRRVIDAVG